MLGAKIYIGHNVHVKNASIIICSIIKNNNPEIIEAKIIYTNYS